jgi:hypothetical protein
MLIKLIPKSCIERAEALLSIAFIYRIDVILKKNNKKGQQLSLLPFK